MSKNKRNNSNEKFQNKVVEDNWQWCILAGNAQFIDDIVYKAIAARRNVDILFREHVTIDDGTLTKEYDLLMLNGIHEIIDSFELLNIDDDALFLRVTIDDVVNNPHLLVVVGLNNKLLYLTNMLDKHDIKFKTLKNLTSSSIINTEMSSKSHIPRIFKSTLNLISFDEEILEMRLISTKKHSNLKKVENLATSNQIFTIDFEDI